MPIPISSSDPAPGDPPRAALLQDERVTAMAAHLLGFAGLAVPFGSVVGPLVVYLAQRERSPFVAGHAREALNFQLWMLVLGLAGLVALLVAVAVQPPESAGVSASFVAVISGIGVGVVWWAGATVVAAARAIEGVPFRYPLTLRLLRPPRAAPPDAEGLPLAPGSGPGAAG